MKDTPEMKTPFSQDTVYGPQLIRTAYVVSRVSALERFLYIHVHVSWFSILTTL